ncbi:MAG: carbohydrate kinase [Actinophytocola sp.]|nr:carbohydrate kinase [Actinophytocola sp.]
MSPTFSVIIGVDCSTTGSKAVAFTPDGSAIAESRRGFSRSTPYPGWQEQHPDDWWHATTQALSELVTTLGEQGAEPVALGLTHQRETFVCLDEHDQPVRPAILWLDTRARAQIDRLGSAEVHELSGKPPSTTPSLYKLAWVAEHEPEVIDRTALVLDVHGYLVRRLTGARATSWACADPLSLLDMRTFSWSPRLLAMAGLAEEQLPVLTAPGTVIGRVSKDAAEATGLPTDLPVVAGAGDGQCAGLGAAVLDQHHAYLNLGTGLTLGTHAADYVHSRAFRTLASPIAGAYTIEALLSSGVLSIAWVRDLLAASDGTPMPEDEFSALATSAAPGADGLLYLPYLTSAESPHWDAAARGCFIGMTDSHSRAEICRAVLEGLAYEERLTLELLEDATGQQVERLVVMGGASRSDALTQLLADVLERPIAISAEPETTALGAAMLAASAAGIDGVSDLTEIATRMSRVSAVREPDTAAHQRYRDTFAVYRDVYPALKPVFPRLSALRSRTTEE